MKRDFKQTIAEFIRDKKRRKQRLVLVSALSVVVVFAVALNMVQPAVTMTPGTVCGLEEHLHGAECYRYELVCGLDGVEGHAHTEACYAQFLTCGLEEHIHGEGCYPDQVADPVFLPSDGEPVVEEMDGVDLMSVTVDAVAQPAIEGFSTSPAAIYPGQPAQIEFSLINAVGLRYRIDFSGETVFGGSVPVETRHYRWSLSSDGSGHYWPTVEAANASDGDTRFVWSWTPDRDGYYAIVLEAQGADGSTAALDSGVNVLTPAEDEQEIIDVQPAEGEQEVVEAQPAEDEQEIIDVQPAEGELEPTDVQPAEDEQEVVEAQPAEDEQEVVEAQPAEDEQEVVEAQPAEDEQEIVEAQPAEDEQEVIDVQPAEGEQEIIDVQPVEVETINLEAPLSENPEDETVGDEVPVSENPEEKAAGESEEQPDEESEDKPDEESEEKSDEESEDKPEEQSAKESEEQPAEESEEQPAEESEDKPEEQSDEESEDKNEEKPDEESEDKSDEESEDKPEEQSAEEAEDETEGKSGEESEDETEGKSAEEAEDKTEEGYEEQSDEETEEKSDEESEEQTEGEETEEEIAVDAAGEEAPEEEPAWEAAWQDGSLAYEGEGFVVRVDYTADAHIPEGAALSVVAQSDEALAQSVALTIQALRAGEDTPVTEEPAEVVTEEPAEAATEEKNEETATEEPAEATTEEPAGAATEEPAEATTEEPAEAATEEPAEATTEAPAETATEEPAEAATEAPAETATEEPAEEAETEENTEEAATEAPTQADGAAKAAQTPAPAEIRLSDAMFFTAAIELEGETVQPEESVTLTLRLDAARDAVFSLTDGGAHVLRGVDELIVEGYAGQAFGFGNVRVIEPEPVSEPESVSEPEPVSEPFQLSYDGGDYELTVDCAPECGLPQGTELRVTALEDEEHDLAAGSATDVLNADADGVFARRLEDACFIRLAFEADGESVAPLTALPVRLSVRGEGDFRFFRLSRETAQLLEGDAGSAEIDYNGEALGFGRVLREQVGTATITHEGGDYTVTASYGPDAALPEGVQLRVEEILPDTQAYEDYNAQVGQMLSESWDAVTDFARYFDISFICGGEAVEPAAPVDVKVSFAEAIPVAEDASMQAVHFADEAPELIDVDAQLADAAEADAVDTLAFSADSFSVYGFVQTGKLIQKVITAEGERFTIEVGYSQEAGIPDGAELIARQVAEDSPEYVDYFEQSLVAIDANFYTSLSVARFFDIEIVKDGDVIEPVVPVDVKITCDEAVELAEGDTLSIVHFAGSGAEVIEDVALSEDGREMSYQQGSFSLTASIVFNRNNPGALNSLSKYAIVMQKPGTAEYYSILSDGSLERISSYSVSGGSGRDVKLNYPFTWTYELHDGKSYLYHQTDAYEFDNETNLPTKCHFRYIDPNTPSGISTDSTTEKDRAWHCGFDYNVYENPNNRDNDYQIFNGSNYLGVTTDENGKLRIRGCVSQSEAWPVFFAYSNVVPNPEGIRHTVNHIDIGVTGGTQMMMEIAPGTYYLGDSKQEWVVPDDDTRTKLTFTADVGIDVEDIKVADIQAYKKDSTGKLVPFDNAFYITGYTGNSEAGGVAHPTPQVRLQGAFRVADLSGMTTSQGKTMDPYPGTYYQANDDPDIRAARLANRIYYSVSLTKKVTFWWTKDGQQIYDDQKRPLSTTLPLTLSATFDYWDEDNECPPILWWGQKDAWKHGAIVLPMDADQQAASPAGNFESGSGMDFVLSSSESIKGLPGVHIVKQVKNTDGQVINADYSEVHPKFNIYSHKDAVDNSVIGKNIEGYNNYEASYSGYSYTAEKTITLGSDGVGMTYEYNIPEGMVYVDEDKSSIPDEIVDADGCHWIYDHTVIETESVWRNGQYDGKTHYSRDYTKADSAYRAVPEILGEYEFSGWEAAQTALGDTYTVEEKNSFGEVISTQTYPNKPYNRFLDFYITNIYRPKEYNVGLLKVETGTTTPLENAKFNLYRVWRGKLTRINEENEPFVTDENGRINFGSLPAKGLYYLQETEAPEGYNLLESFIYFEIRSENEGSERSIIHYIQSDNSASQNDESIEFDEQTATWYITATNSRGYTLPETGGTGTQLLTLGGLALMLVSAMLYGCGIRRRRERGAAR